MIDVAVKPGWAGGRWHTRDFEAALKQAGYNVSSEFDANVIIAHSVACYDLKLKSPATYFILIDPPYWPKKHIAIRFFEKTRQDITSLKRAYGWRYVAKKIFWGLFYVAARPQYTVLALKRSDDLTFLEALKGKNVRVVRNSQDSICSADIKVALAAYPDFNYYELPGQHDDYYINPKPYIDLLPTTL
jgi:hypothetical protein